MSPLSADIVESSVTFVCGYSPFFLRLIVFVWAVKVLAEVMFSRESPHPTNIVTLFES